MLVSQMKRAKDAGLGVTVHVAEVTSLKFVYSAEYCRRLRTSVKTPMRFCLLARLVSVTQHSWIKTLAILLRRIVSRLRSASPPICCGQLCPCCVMTVKFCRCKTVPKLDDHHIKHWLLRDHPIAICVRALSLPRCVVPHRNRRTTRCRFATPLSENMRSCSLHRH